MIIAELNISDIYHDCDSSDLNGLLREMVMGVN